MKECLCGHMYVCGIKMPAIKSGLRRSFLLVHKRKVFRAVELQRHVNLHICI